MKGWRKMRISDMAYFSTVILECQKENKVMRNLYKVWQIRNCIEGIREEYGNKFNVYRLKSKEIELDAKEMVKCYIDKIQKDIYKIQKDIDNTMLRDGYNVEKWILPCFTEQEYSALDYILSNALSKLECNAYPVKIEKIEIDI